MIPSAGASRPPPGNHADRDPDLDHDPRRRPGLAGDPVPDRPAAAPRRPAPDASAYLSRRPPPTRRAGCSSQSFTYADLFNTHPNGFNSWYYSHDLGTALYDPLVQDTPYYGGDPFANGPPIYSSGPLRPPPVDLACHSRMIRSGGGRPTTPTAAFISMTLPA